MAFEYPGEGVLNYQPCRYGSSKLVFRGPRKRLDRPYVAVLGGTETYGKYVEEPFPDLLETALRLPVVNLGCVNAGPDVFGNDAAVMSICRDARVTVVQITGAQNLSNRFYSVHPRRNDRFLRASSLLQTIYREVDFTEFNFTRHLLETLEAVSPEKFAMVRQELKDAWVARMKSFLTRVGSRVVLVWLSRHGPDDIARTGTFSGDPLFVDRAMLDEVRPLVREIVEVVADDQEVEAGFPRLVYPEMDVAMAREMLGPIVHARAALALDKAVGALL